jgi:cation:H+ antiporter
MTLDILLLVVGLLLLFKGGDWVVAGASALARRYGIRDIVIGLTIVAFATSMPEMVVSVLASAKGNAVLSVANVIGSNIANILLILGVAAVIYPLFAGHGTVWKEIPFVLLASVVLAIMANDRAISGDASNLITRGDGLLLLALFSVFLYYIGQLIAQGLPEADAAPGPEAEPRSPALAATLLAAGLVMLVLGGHWVVEGAVAVAAFFGMSEKVIGLTLVAVGTSLPELATSAVAAYRKNAAIAVGNVVGSNIFNILWILGVSSVVRPLEVAAGSNTDILVMFVAAVLLFVAMFTGRPRHQIQRFEGFGFLTLYVAYVGWLIARG